MTTDSPRPILTANDLYLFNEGSHYRVYHQLGAHVTERDGIAGVQFAVWAPSASRVMLIGDFNGWNREVTPMEPQGNSGIWATFIPGLGQGALYKYHIISHHGGHRADKADPVGFLHEIPPKTGSVVWDLKYEWQDGDWMKNRRAKNSLESPISIYEVHIGSWARVPEDGFRSLNYRELAPRLAAHVKALNFTHVEFLPVMEHPFFGSWGYQTTGYFAPTSRFGTPQDFMYLVDYLHQNGIGVILDWVPSHFPTDEHGLAYFDGTHLYEHADPRQGFHPDWKSSIFNFGRHEVRSFLLSSAMFWLEKYHVDGLRVDAVASMLYLDYSRQPGEWVPNMYGGNENLEAIGFLRRLNEEVYRNYPDVQTYAEESTAWAAVSKPTYIGGLGFGLKWDMGWMHDTLQYMRRDPIYRSFHHNELLFRMQYAFSENFVMPLSHDEVVHGKGSLLDKMPGDDWQKLASLRLTYGYMYGMPGKKLLFMGSEVGQWSEWRHDTSIDWHLLQWDRHQGIFRWLSDLNRVYRDESAFWAHDTSWAGFEWIECHDAGSSILTFMRRGRDHRDKVIIICNFTPVPRYGYRVGVPIWGGYKEILNSDAREYGGSGIGNSGFAWTDGGPWHNQPHSIFVNVPPLAVVMFRPD